MRLTTENWRECVSYDPDTGSLRWLKTLGPRAPVGAEVGSLFANKSGNQYRMTTVNGRRVYVHRFIHFIMTGLFPHGEIDHLNGDGLDNRWCNLRSVTRQENMRNRRRCSRNSTGILGVTWDDDRGKWLARIAVNGKSKNLGRFVDFFEAACVRKSAELKYGYFHNHSRGALS